MQNGFKILLLAKEGVHKGILKKLTLPQKTPKLQDWQKIVRKFKSKRKEISIGIVGKYLKLRDAYKSLFEALEHASFQQGLKLKIVNCDPELLEKKVASIPRCDGFLVPGGFGKRGSEGKILYIKNAREKDSFLWYLLRISNGNRRIRQKCSRFERCIFCRN